MCCESTDASRGDCCASQMDCGCGRGQRRFLTREEKIEMLEKYKKELEKEILGVEDRIKEVKG
ncbi:MAG: hypothetical protein SVM80_11215 [Halobacteriota archaeon]|nr:hypothetical protein [Halobacteriota archaeon]